ncbi:hypothetical protein Back11_53060 [Paenibacillus baekrokdamisoli]|uniref:Uncharacterized protein n=1 Tax=Paenibacillus baekrokdamisoli TaxID=1712516 RepID=A0A3G9JDH3_9BACL|nr:hypothetical protein [Paenibacillus baekrokdamisoli]BBH23961.1 hypothetical protein Back11_53060 [Paenibacillus baekrokdamisoli]
MQPFVIFYKLYFIFLNGILLLVAFEANKNDHKRFRKKIIKVVDIAIGSW